MRRLTCQKLKPILIAWCCLCVVITNCDENLLAGSSEPQMPGHHGSVKMEKSERPDGSEIPKVDLNKEKSVETNSKSVKSGSETSSGLNGDKSNGVEHITSKKPGNSETNHMTINSNSTTKPVFTGLPQPINFGALQRGIYVFLGLSVIVVAYIVFRCARLSKNRTQMVRKYGVLAHRQDVEMRPLPLDDEDEDDTTVFDASEVGVHHKRHERT